MRRVERVIELHAPAERVFDLLADFEAWPQWLRHVKEVRRTGRRTTRWRARMPHVRDLVWAVETVVFEPDRRIVWRSVGGAVAADGEVVITAVDAMTTRLRVVLGYAAPAGQRGDAYAWLFAQDPAAELGTDLRRFKHSAEGRGRRDEAQRRAVFDERVRFTRADYARHAWRAARADYEPRPGAQLRAAGEVAGERRFADALQSARRSQRESRRRYRMEGYPAPAWQHMIEVERELRRPARRVSERRPPDDEARRRGRTTLHEVVPRADRPRYALTPRERARELAERGWDREAKERVLRRGVDRLLDAGPSQDWRRWD